MVTPPTTALATTRTEQFVDLVDKRAPIADISVHLDALSPERRIAEVRRMGGARQAKLWDLAKGKGNVDIAAFVEGASKVNIYAGKNSLLFFTHFQKRFWRAPSGEVAGYNHNGALVSFFTGPGYFMVSPAGDGELVFDYTKIPTEKPSEWPAVRTNSGLIAGVVYGGMLDYVRFVSNSTIIGAAFKGGKPRNAYFLLTRSV
jgi:hypothetical protein